MKVHKPEAIDSFQDLARVEPTIYDNSSIMSYKSCARHYKFRMVLGYTEKIEPLYFTWGTALHKFWETLEVETKKGMGAGPVFKRAILEASLSFDGRYTPPKDPKNKYAWMTKARMKVAAEALYKFWLKEKSLGRIEVIAVEQPFIVELFDNIFIGGRADQVLQIQGGDKYGRDLKNTSKSLKYFQRDLDPNHQFILYTYAESILTNSNVKGQLILAASTMKTQATEVEQYTVNYTKHQIEQWRKECGVWIRRIEESRATDIYPANENSCYRCPFHWVCKQKGELSQANTLKRSYKFEPWDHANPGKKVVIE